VAAVRRAGAKVAFLSNKAIRPSHDYAAKLKRLGIPVEESDVVSSMDALILRLSKIAPAARLYVIGEPPLEQALRAAGFRLSSDEKAVDYVVLSMDRTFHYGKLNLTMKAVRNGARLCATNPDRTCPFEGYELPDAAGIIAAVEAVTGKRVEFIAGKPSPLLIETALQRMDVEARESIVVGDRLDTDILMGKNAGTATAVVLTGVTTREMRAASKIEPDFTLESVADILDWPQG
jgi:NagD protein